MTGVKLDTSVRGDSAPAASRAEEHLPGSASPNQLTKKPIKQKSIHMPKTTVAQKTLELQLQPVVSDQVFIVIY